MEFRTVVDIPTPPFQIEPLDELLFVGSCFADNIGQRFRDQLFPVTVNPFGTMYNPVSVLHTIERMRNERREMRNGDASHFSFPVSHFSFRIVFITLGTNHVYRLKETGEIVDNCEKRPARLFQEETLGVDECADYLRRAVELLCEWRPDVQVVFTVSPIRYRKYGYHESQLSKATLLLAVDKLVGECSMFRSATSGDASLAKNGECSMSYFPAYELLMDELRDYRFYASDMLHPSEQAVDYIWEQLVAHYFSSRAKQFLSDWRPLREALHHRPFHPDSPEHHAFVASTREKLERFRTKYGIKEPFASLLPRILPRSSS